MKANSHISIKPTLVWQCPFCDTVFFSAIELKKHIRKQNYVQPPIKFTVLKPLTK